MYKKSFRVLIGGAQIGRKKNSEGKELGARPFREKSL